MTKKADFWHAPQLWPGETVFIIGGGPSLEGMDLTSIHSRRVIGVNDAYTLGKWVDICFFGDYDWWTKHNKDWIQPDSSPGHAGLKKFGGLVVTNAERCRQDSGVLVMSRRPKGLHLQAEYLGWNANSGAAAINLAIILGAKKIVLLGFDMKLGNKGQMNWHKNKKAKPNPGLFDKFQTGFAELKKGIDKLRPDAEVVNATPNSDLTIWPMVELKPNGELVLLSSPTPSPVPAVPVAEPVFPVAETVVGKDPTDVTDKGITDIPKILHFFWIGGKLPDYADFLMGKWREMNPEFEIRLHGEEVLRPEYKPIYDLLATPSTKVDVLKWSALRNDGGYTIDIDTVPLRPLSTFTDTLDASVKFMAVNVPPADEKPGMERCDMGFIGATTDSRIWAAVDWYMAGNVDMAPYDRRGTKGGTCAMEWLLTQVPHLMTRFPASIYCPYGCKAKDRPWMEKGRLFWRAYRAGEDVLPMLAEYNEAFNYPWGWHIWARVIT